MCVSIHSEKTKQQDISWTRFVPRLLSGRDTCLCSDTGTCRHRRRDAWPRLSCLAGPGWPARPETFPGMRRPRDRRAPQECWSRWSLLNTSNISVTVDLCRWHTWERKQRRAAHLVCPPCCQRRSSLRSSAHIWWRTRSGSSRYRAQQTAPVCLWWESAVGRCDTGKLRGSPEWRVYGAGAGGESAPEHKDKRRSISGNHHLGRLFEGVQWDALNRRDHWDVQTMTQTWDEHVLQKTLNPVWLKTESLKQLVHSSSARFPHIMHCWGPAANTTG